MIKELLEKYDFNYTSLTLKPNFMKMPVNRCDLTVDGAKIFNEFYQAVYNDPEMTKLVRTPSGGISYAGNNFIPPAYDIIPTYTHGGNFSGIEITVATEYMFRVQFCGKPTKAVPGSTAIKEFTKVFKKFGIDLNKYKLNKIDGLKAKEEIEKPLICLENNAYKHLTFENNVHHLDYHSSYPTGLMNTHPEMAEPLKWMYENRKLVIQGKKDWYKSVMNSSIGWMQSKWSHFTYASLARDAINDNNKRIKDLAQRINNSGRDVLLYNTDGIWYSGELYHDENEGKTLGTWANDHINCKFRIKSDGAYEYIEDGKYTPVVRGATKYDRLVPRDQWQWGDIFREDAEPVLFSYVEGEGIRYE